ncbi:glutathione S-transferase U9 [Silene latifolia]|uniref:glutathione S-transferase U9 n=1 Tax=Silene latifolia TaxID=37657 RepID=UPI003D774B0C
MEEEKEVRVHGMWASTYSKRVELALKIKGIPYEYVEEDLMNKSQALLEYNPIHKKIPILVHNGKPIVESLVILEYIDEVWPDHAPKLLPQDPFQRARVRFWAGFLQNQLLESVLKLFKSSEEEQEKALDELHEKMTIMEQEMGDLIPKDVSSIQIKSLGLLDIQVISTLGAYKAQEQVLGVKVLDPHKHSLIYAWVNAMMDLPMIKESTPPHDDIVNLLHMIFKVPPSV